MATRDRDTLEEQFEAAGKTKYVTNAMVDDEILASQYHQFEGTTTTVCLITLKNGFTVLGKSACANPDNFEQELGEKLAFDDARQQIFSYLGFRICDESQA